MRLFVYLLCFSLILFESKIFGQSKKEFRVGFNHGFFQETTNSGISEGIIDTDKYDSIGVNLQCVSAPSISIGYQHKIKRSNFYWSLSYKAQSLHYQSTIVQHYYNPNSISPPTSEINLYNRMNIFALGLNYRLNLFENKFSIDFMLNVNYRYFEAEIIVVNKFQPQIAVGEYGYRTQLDFSPSNKKLVFETGLKCNYNLKSNYSCFLEFSFSPSIYAGFFHTFTEIESVKQTQTSTSSSSVTSIIDFPTLEKRSSFIQLGLGLSYSIHSKNEEQ